MSLLNDLKRRHNAIHEIGADHSRPPMKTYDEMMELQRRIKEIEGADYDPIPLIFGGGFHIHAEDE